MTFKGLQRTLNYTQTNNGNIDDVFPLLCPVREADWLDGWRYKMVHSESGLIEKDCVFTTPHHGKLETVWHVISHDPIKYFIEFIRVTPGENVVRIKINCWQTGVNQTSVRISYQYTALNEEQNEFIANKLETVFIDSMLWWEKAINYYLENGEMLKK